VEQQRQKQQTKRKPDHTGSLINCRWKREIVSDEYVASCFTAMKLDMLVNIQTKQRLNSKYKMMQPAE
jgi:hypothetical protein